MTDQDRRDREQVPEEDREQAPEDELAREEADAAAAEAGSIGGRGGAEGVGESERPIAEGGGGVAEGFEQAEKDLIDSAERGKERNPIEDAGEVEDQPDPAVHGEPDTARASEAEEESES
jgi:hypothetical protein